MKEIQDQYESGLVTNGERYNKVVDIWSRTNDQIGKAMMDQLRFEEGHRPQGPQGPAGLVQLHLHDGRLRRARLRGADPPAGRHARPDGEAGRLDHRDADHGELPRGPERPAVLHLDPRRPQGPRGHRAEDRELRLPDAPSRRRRPGPRRHAQGLRHDARPRGDADRRGRRRGRGPRRARARPRGRDRRRRSRAPTRC